MTLSRHSYITPTNSSASASFAGSKAKATPFFTTLRRRRFTTWQSTNRISFCCRRSLGESRFRRNTPPIRCKCSSGVSAGSRRTALARGRRTLSCRRAARAGRETARQNPRSFTQIVSPMGRHKFCPWRAMPPTRRRSRTRIEIVHRGHERARGYWKRMSFTRKVSPMGDTDFGDASRASVTNPTGG